MNKLKRVKVSTPDGDKYIMFRPVIELPSDKLICVSDCPYGEICGKLPDPRDPQNKELCFADFCNSLGEGEGEDEELVGFVPVDGELEKVFLFDKDILKVMIKDENPMYRLSDIINKCCPGVCDLYSPDYEHCTIKNKMCLLRGLFIKESFKGNNNK